jgi:hypothetical protein
VYEKEVKRTEQGKNVGKKKNKLQNIDTNIFVSGFLGQK